MLCRFTVLKVSVVVKKTQDTVLKLSMYIMIDLIEMFVFRRKTKGNVTVSAVFVVNLNPF